MTSSIEDIFAAQHAALAASPAASTLTERRAALRRLHGAVKARERALIEAMAGDFGKGAVEVQLTELLPLYQEIATARRRLRGWMRGRRAWPGLALFGTSTRLRPDPKGLALILGPSNYPFMLALGPLVSALAAGNRVIVKPSELAPRTAALVAEVIGACFEPDQVAAVQGGAETAEALTRLPFDHVFFTGSTRIGQRVMAAAAQHLATVTLELGGKSPVILGPDADLAQAARMVAWGKLTNGGQACVSPDHVYVLRRNKAAFLSALKAELARMEPDAARSITPQHLERMEALIQDAKAAGAAEAWRGIGGPGRYPPVVLTRISPEMAVMAEEIFGPILPVIAYDDPAEAIAAINARAKPLTIYVFAHDPHFARRVADETRSGSVAVNLTMAHFAHPTMPFGGVGASGQGAAHGHAGFLAFSHEKPVVVNHFAPLGLLMPPVTARVRQRARLALAWMRGFG